MKSRNYFDKHFTTQRRSEGTYYDNDTNRKSVRRRGKELINAQLNEFDELVETELLEDLEFDFQDEEQESDE